MKKSILLFCLFALISGGSIYAQRTELLNAGSSLQSVSQLGLKDWLEGKKFKHRDNGLVVQYGYISSLNTYGFTFTNAYYNKFYFINCSSEITSDQTYGVFSECINPDNGSGIGKARVYRSSKKIVIGDASGEFTYYLVED